MAFGSFLMSGQTFIAERLQKEHSGEAAALMDENKYVV